MFGSQYFGQLILAVGIAVTTVTPPSDYGTDGGGMGSQYFGQYWPSTASAPPPPPAGTDGGGLGSPYFGQYWPGISSSPAPAPDSTAGGYSARARRRSALVESLPLVRISGELHATSARAVCDIRARSLTRGTTSATSAAATLTSAAAIDYTADDLELILAAEAAGVL